MRDLRQLRFRPRRRNPYPAATDQDLDAFERHFGIQLPLSYRDFLKEVNGGLPELREYEDPHGAIGEVNDFYGLGSLEKDSDIAAKDADDWEIGNLWGETRIRRPYVGPRGIPFARDGGDNQLFLDYTISPPCVSRLVVSTRRTYKIAASFSDFLDMLRPVTPET